MKPYLENIVMPDGRLPFRGFVSTTKERVIMVHPHWHTEVEMLYYIEGSALQQVNDCIFTAMPGDIVIIGKDQLHSTYSAGIGDCSIMVLQFDADALLAASERPGVQGADFSNETVYANPVRASSGEGSLLLKEFEAIYGELAHKETAYEMMARASLYRFAGLLARSGLYEVRKEYPGGIKSVHAMLEKTFRMVDDSFSDGITLDDAAAASNLSTTHFCRLFRRATGMTFHEYLTFYRINRAEKLLHPSRKLADIAFECGFGSVTSFIRNFRRYKNCAPSRYMLDAYPKDSAGK